MVEAAIDTILEGGNGFGSYYRSGGPDLEALEKAEAVLDAWIEAHGGKKLRGVDAGEDDQDKENTPALSQQSRSQSQSQEQQVQGTRSQTEPLKESNAVLNARRVVEIFESVYPRWQQLVAEKGTLEGRARGLERFDEGYILTRVVYKGAAALGVLKEYDREILILEELLAQTRWRRGKRGAWYDRLALILMHHKAKAAKQGVLTDADAKDGNDEERVLRQAMDAVVRGLHDEDTHIGGCLFNKRSFSPINISIFHSLQTGTRTPPNTARETSENPRKRVSYLCRKARQSGRHNRVRNAYKGPKNRCRRQHTCASCRTGARSHCGV